MQDKEKYGTRICLVCNKEFLARYPSQVVCSAVCRQTRIGNQKERSKNRFIKQIDCLLAECEFYENELRSIFKQGIDTPDKHMSNDISKHELKVCKKMNLRAINLPCGERPECWEGKPCSKVKDIQKPDFASKFKREFGNPYMQSDAYETTNNY